MALYENLPVYKAGYDLLLETCRQAVNFAREYRYTLGEKLQGELMEILVCIYRANSSQEGRSEVLAEARRRLVKVKLYIRMLHDLKVISLKQFALQAERVENLSRQLSAWHRKTLLPGVGSAGSDDRPAESGESV